MFSDILFSLLIKSFRISIESFSPVIKTELISLSPEITVKDWSAGIDLISSLMPSFEILFSKNNLCSEVLGTFVSIEGIILLISFSIFLNILKEVFDISSTSPPIPSISSMKNK